MSELVVEPAGQEDLGCCDCCGKPTRSVRGFVHGPDQSAYFVRWTPGGVAEHGAHFDIVIGGWGDGTTAADRSSVALEFRQTESGPAFMVVDAKKLGGGELALRPMPRSQVVGTATAASVFRIVDAVWLQDDRLQELRGAAA